MLSGEELQGQQQEVQGLADRHMVGQANLQKPTYKDFSIAPNGLSAKVEMVDYAGMQIYDSQTGNLLRTVPMTADPQTDYLQKINGVWTITTVDHHQ